MKHFEPKNVALELNKDNVQAIFNRCLASSETVRTIACPGYIFMRAPDAAASEDFPACRFLASDSVPPGYHAWPAVEFDAGKLSENKATIAYLYGQLKNRHEENILLRADDIACTYSGKRWTDNAWMMAMLVALGSPNAFLLPSTFSEPVTGTLVLSFDATLSPEDPNFPAWREARKAGREA